MMSLAPTALITGASAGIGMEFSRQLAALGYNLIITARREERLQELAATLRNEFHVEIEVIKADLSQLEGIHLLVERISTLDNLELVINNAGFGTKGKFRNVTLEKLGAMAQVHMLAPVLLSRAALPGMIARHRGTIINVASMAGFFPYRSVLYGSSKSFLITFTQSLNLELAGTGVHVQALCPGFTFSEFHATPELDGFYYQRIPKILWLSSGQVVRHSLKDLSRRKEISIPGWQYQCVALLARNSITNHLIRGIAKILFNKERIA